MNSGAPWPLENYFTPRATTSGKDRYTALAGRYPVPYRLWDHLAMVAPQSMVDPEQGRSGYRRHKPKETPLYPVIESALPVLLSRMSEQGSRLPGFVTREFDQIFLGRRLHRNQQIGGLWDCVELGIKANSLFVPQS